ncbi:hypothetical protein BAUCODRAFT_210537 [Baudoinia panamericana UAMH 10762]|uniref:HhH-GPD domain-containing protein n=1 Tax=Baudoinia panamericana (strain UAMH 10762) TaxID=717646 RepID=M2N4V4_BAUPA|nr:uncharacterized protein BAUCODRAFT_210537 [Baudoinia panamericana UAMH 10762]EMC93790.1 hypothetical protein BAUCODRAFT_210537 [Baudoinia panamericana UAMH 10762]
MARTRAQGKVDAGNKASGPRSQKQLQPSKQKVPKKRKEEPESEAQEEPAGGEAAEEGEGDITETVQPRAKMPRGEKDKDVTKGGSKVDDHKIEKLLNEHGDLPLSHTALKEPSKPTAETMLAHLFNALLTSTRISHKLAEKTVNTVLEAGWADLATLEKTTWEERTRVLTEGGYTHYREKTATQMGDLVEWIRTTWKGNLNNLLAAAKDTDSTNVRDEVRKRVQKIKGIGNVALDIFCDTAQGVWPELAPFLDPRSIGAAEQMGLPASVDELYAMVGKDPVKMCKLATALTAVRLEGAVDEVAKASGA